MTLNLKITELETQLLKNRKGIGRNTGHKRWVSYHSTTVSL